MSQQQDLVILVNEFDEYQGTMEKLAAHRAGALHRAFSIFILNDKDELLIHQRAEGKYHSGGLWTNACCSHPRPGESTLTAAHRRLMEEMGFDCTLEPLFHLRYRSEVANELVEHEYDHIFLGRYSGPIRPNLTEVKDYRFLPLAVLLMQMREEPQQFTRWFHLAMPQFLQSMGGLRESRA